MNRSNTQLNIEFDSKCVAEQLRKSHHPLRHFFKGFYLRKLLRDVRGLCIDFGCGVSGQTHKMFVCQKWLDSNMPIQLEGFMRCSFKYLPENWEWIGRYFVFHEMKIVFDNMRSS